MFEDVEIILRKTKMKFLFISIFVTLILYACFFYFGTILLLLLAAMATIYTISKNSTYTSYLNFVLNVKREDYITLYTKTPTWIFSFIDKKFNSKYNFLTPFRKGLFHGNESPIPKRYKIFTRAILINKNVSKEIQFLLKNGSVKSVIIDTEEDDLVISFNKDEYEIKKY